ncbi:nucleotidyltransferase family protein [Roseofilum casamattae]|uniref:Nucleotidyltransferase domain-containing protein n=1 Tax=Roseofilum casamattae BLCC-M143 TaxID=3022442 RepID=A0ABT7BZR9_9CYAN|nr:nucleotidyltransferase domain-containing protein [Roseofilum casamattae]MDJ1184666.1 nucleotidyltransferase domain-containing protein [Roseofilum casamattae BLCC-M143]
MSTTVEDCMYVRLGITPKELVDFCQRWSIVELALFGSILRDDFHLDSDVDVLVTFTPNHAWGLEFIQMREELAALFHRPVDLLTRQSIMHSHNVLRRATILNSAEVIYAAG